MVTIPRIPVAVAWLVLFLGVYFSQPLPNNGNIVRWELWPLLPFAVMDAVDPPVEAGSPPRGWAYVGQRLPLMGTAAGIALMAFGVGFALLSWGATGGSSGPPVSSGSRTDVGKSAGSPKPLPVAPEAEQMRPTLLPCERWFFAGLIGFGYVSLAMLGLGLCGVMSRWGLIAVGVAPIVVLVGVQPLGCVFAWKKAKSSLKAGLQLWLLAAVAPFLIGMLFGSLSPSTDFDVNEYHLGGPKEWFLAGRITLLEHNVYTSFPFLTEMLLLAGMVIHGDWFHGGLAGQLVLMLFAPLTALGVYCVGRRWFSPLAGSLGALIYLTTPWVFRMSIIAYAEGGLTAYTGGAIVAGLLAIQRIRERSETFCVDDFVPRAALRSILLTGLCAGGAMACKYTGLVMAVAPWAGILTLITFLRGQRIAKGLDRAAFPPLWRLRPVLFTAVIYFTGVVAMVGPWLAKNLVETGNPVYPLGYSVFGGRDLDDELATKWKNGHARPNKGSVVGEVRDLFVKVFDVATVNDWTSPLVFAFAPLAVLWPGERRRVYTLMGLTAWLFLCWWLLTHHLDRFWLPLLPAACALAGIGAASFRGRMRPVAVTMLAIGWVYNLGFCSTGLVGYNAGLTDLNYAGDYASRITGPEIAWLNAALDDGTLPRETRVLCVGEAELFHARFSYDYNTVFDRSIFEEYCGEPGDGPSKDRPLRSADEIRMTLAGRGITHVLVNWGEIVRYRQTYGYTDFVHPARFHALQELGVLGEPLRWPEGLGRRKLDALSSGERELIEKWAPELIVPCGEDRCVITGQVFPVVR